MNSNELSLDVAKTNSLKTMRLVDTSKYCNEDIPENYLIEVLPVNKKAWVVFHVMKDFSLTLNSSNLGYKKVDNSADLADIPDGVYEIKQSHKPNLHTLCHYYHLRTVALSFKYIQLLCSHFNEECKKTEKDYANEVSDLIKIKQYIDAAEFTVSEKHDKDTGIKYYNKAVELMNRYEKSCGCK